MEGAFLRSNSKYSVSELLNYINLYLQDGISVKELQEVYGLQLGQSNFYQKVLRYQQHGINGIKSHTKNHHYSKEFKKKVVNEHLNEGIPIRQLARNYAIPSHNTVRNWVNKYTKGKEIKNYHPKPEVYKMKSRKTTQDEKLQIIKDCLDNGLSYKDTAEKYAVSYNNVYSWVQKYKEYSPDGLFDGRGRGKPNSIQTEEEKLRTELAALKARNEYLETENAALKKLKEVERELMLHEHAMKRNTKRLRKLINLIIDVYEEFKGIYGYRRITIYLNRYLNAHVNHKCVCRLMKLMNLKAIIRRKRYNYKPHNPAHTAENRLNREFKKDNPPMTTLLTDVTEFKYGHASKAYLSAILDYGTNKIVAYKVSKHNNNALVMDTVKQIECDIIPGQTLLHSDRGFQYTSHGFRHFIDKHQVIQSMSRVGRCIDNGPMENFWGIIKEEMYRVNDYDQFEQLEKDIDRYIKFYNTQRVTLKMGLRIPA